LNASFSALPKPFKNDSDIPRDLRHLLEKAPLIPADDLDMAINDCFRRQLTIDLPKSDQRGLHYHGLLQVGIQNVV